MPMSQPPVFRKQKYKLQSQSLLVIGEQPLFSPACLVLLIIATVLLFLSSQLYGIYIFTPYVFDDTSLSAVERFELGSFNGTVLSYTILFTLLILSVFIYLILQWRFLVTQPSQLNESSSKSVAELRTELPNNSNKNTHTNPLEIITSTDKIKDYLAIKNFSFVSALLLLGIWTLFLILSEVVTTLLGKDTTEFVVNLYDTAQPIWLLCFSMVVIAPIYEELVFRGLLWSAISEQFPAKQGVLLASFVTSVIFAVIHMQYDWYAMSVIFILALIMSYARYKSGSLLLPIALHILNNGMAMLQFVVNNSS